MELMGLPADVANGTNRVGVAANASAAALGFYRGKRFEQTPERRRDTRLIVGLVTLGALLGIYFSLIISNEAFRQVFRYLLVVMLVVILVKPKRWLAVPDDDKVLPLWLSIPLYFALGIYGGFIQMGMGVFFLAVMVLVARYEIIQANAVKALAIVVYTFVAVGIFAWRGLIDWPVGLLMAFGQMTGGYLTAKYASSHPRAGEWAYRLLVVVVIGAILKAFGGDLAALF